jgi:hypothetical protein
MFTYSCPLAKSTVEVRLTVPEIGLPTMSGATTGPATPGAPLRISALVCGPMVLFVKKM